MKQQFFQCLCSWGHYSTSEAKPSSEWSCPHESKTFEGISVCSSRLVWWHSAENGDLVKLAPKTYAVPDGVGNKVQHPELAYWQEHEKAGPK
jgi:hypothetical protein